MPNDVTDMPERVPKELVALRMTAPRHWIEELYPNMSQNGSLAGRMTEAAGGFETTAGPFPAFLHVYEALEWSSKRDIGAGPEFDGLINELFAADRLGAVHHLIQVEAPDMLDQEFLALRRQLLEVETQYQAVLFQYKRARDRAPNASIPYEEANARALRDLAGRPEWSVHLFVLSYMGKGTDWYDQEVIDRIAAHGNPVSMRFLAAKGMIDPALVPEPAKDPYKTPSGARVIPSSRPQQQTGHD